MDQLVTASVVHFQSQLGDAEAVGDITADVKLNRVPGSDAFQIGISMQPLDFDGLMLWRGISGCLPLPDAGVDFFSHSDVRFAVAAVPEIPFRIGVFVEPGVEAFLHFCPQLPMLIGVGKIVQLVRVRLQVIEFHFRCLSEPLTIFPIFRANRSDIFEFVKNQVVPVLECLATEGGRKITARGDLRFDGHFQT